MPEVMIDMLLKIVEFAPAVAILIWVAWRADVRAQECLAALIKHLDDTHD